LSITIDKATIEFIDGPAPLFGKPASPDEGFTEDQVGEVQKFRVTTLDTLNMVFGIVTWPNGRPEVRHLETLGGLKKYERLEPAGRWTFVPLENGFWVGELNVMKIGKNKDYSTLHGTNLDELAGLAKLDVAAYLTSLGANEVGTREEIHGEVSKQRNRLAMLVKPGSNDVIAAAFTITRVLAIMNDLGEKAQ
jgi:hypothetical protein